MPAEWEPHSATWLGWPHNVTDWPGKFQPIPWVYAEIVRNLARGERVEIIVNNAAAEQRARDVLHKAHALSDNVRFHRWPTNRGWARDFSPLFVRRPGSPKNEVAPPSSRLKGSSSQETSVAGQGGDFPGKHTLATVNFRFNAWAKYPDWELDQAAADRIVEFTRVPPFKPVAEMSGKLTPLVLEGGSIDVNGRGTLITTEECLLSSIQARNPGLSRDQLERAFADWLGATHVIWLGRGIAGDDTHGHVDDITRFVHPTTVVTAIETNTQDANHAPLRQNLEILRKAADQDGHRLNVIELPMPAPIYFRGRRLPASYANFYIANAVVLAPVFNDPNDRLALNLLAELFPGRRITPISCGDLIWGLGAIHCMTQQQPAP